MKKHKYVIDIRADYTKGIFGELDKYFGDLLPNLKVLSDKTQAVNITSDRILTPKEENYIVQQYQDGISKINLPMKGKLVASLKYVGLVDVIQEEPNEINILEKF